MASSDKDLYGKIHTLIQGQFDGALSPAELLEMESLLLESAAARRAYVQYVQESACLRWLCVEESIGPIEKCDPRHELSDRKRRRRIQAFALSGSIAVVLTIVAANWFFVSKFDSISSQSDEPAKMASTSPPTLSGNVAATSHSRGATTRATVSPKAPIPTEPVATITGVGAPLWSHSEHKRQLLSRCFVGERLQLRQGSAELTFDAGAQVTVFGPADFEITSPTSIRCRKGRVTALVDERGKGFTIQTPRAKVVDLGTQFGLSVSDEGETEVVVFQGSVDLSSSPNAESNDKSWRRMTQGEALLVKNSGEFERVFSIQRNIFLAGVDGFNRRAPEPVIADVTDNIRDDESIKSYQLVHGGFAEDALCFVDRNHQWNSVDDTGLPEFLKGADYIMPFNDDKFVRSLELKVRLLRPATLYVFLDNNMEVPHWVRDEFTDTGVDIGLDGAKTEWHSSHSLGVGANRSIDFTFSVWQREIKKPGTVTLGSVNPPAIGSRSYGFNMYGIAAVAAE